MGDISAFDILGPIMIGPSSSHTAGAARLAKVARDIAGENFHSVNFILHGSFAETYKGHGTDKALVAGILGMSPHNINLKNSYNIADKKGIEISFEKSDLGDVHPNTVKIVFNKTNNMKTQVTGSSIGGGNIIITNIDNYDVSFTGEYPTIIIKQKDQKGVISNITTLLANYDINIATMKVSRKNKGTEASTIIETDNKINDELLCQLRKQRNILYVKSINPVKES